jgi:hypothetical protein
VTDRGRVQTMVEFLATIQMGGPLLRRRPDEASYFSSRT